MGNCPQCNSNVLLYKKRTCTWGYEPDDVQKLIRCTRRQKELEIEIEQLYEDDFDSLAREPKEELRKVNKSIEALSDKIRWKSLHSFNR